MAVDFKSYYFEELSLGMRESFMKTVMADDIVGFAQLSGDHNPIHLSDHFAKHTRFGERIAHGLYTASLISAVLGMKLPGPGAVYLSQTLNFRGPVKIGDVVTVCAEVVELEMSVDEALTYVISMGSVAPTPPAPRLVPNK